MERRARRRSSAGSGIKLRVAELPSRRRHATQCAGVHAGIYKTTAFVSSGLKINSKTGSAMILSNPTGASINDLAIRVPGEALAVKASILGSATGVHIRGLRIYGGKGIALGDEAYGPVRDFKVENIFMNGASPGFAFRGGRRKEY